jgi:hypothetical protein
MGGDIGIHKVIPDPDNLGFLLALVEAQTFEHAGNDGPGRAGAIAQGAFGRGQVDASPFGEDLAPRDGGDELWANLGDGKRRRSRRRRLLRLRCPTPLRPSRQARLRLLGF